VAAAKRTTDLKDGVVVGLRVGDLENDIFEISLHDARFQRRREIARDR
jgi:hypothetical protein